MSYGARRRAEWGAGLVVIINQNSDKPLISETPRYELKSSQVNLQVTIVSDLLLLNSNEID